MFDPAHTQHIFSGLANPKTTENTGVSGFLMVEAGGVEPPDSH